MQYACSTTYTYFLSKPPGKCKTDNCFVKQAYYNLHEFQRMVILLTELFIKALKHPIVAV